MDSAQLIALADELAARHAKVIAANGHDWHFPWRVVADSGKPTIAGKSSGNLFRGFIGTWAEADLVVALANNLPAITASLRALAKETTP